MLVAIEPPTSRLPPIGCLVMVKGLTFASFVVNLTSFEIAFVLLASVTTQRTLTVPEVKLLIVTFSDFSPSYSPKSEEISFHSLSLQYLYI